MKKSVKESIKGYKVFNYDWTCRGYQYEVGKEFKYNGILDICESGFHFCEKLEDCFSYYSCVQWNRIAEVEALGRVIRHDKDSKICTNHIKLIREISFGEIYEIMKKPNEELLLNKAIISSKGVYDSKGINKSGGVKGSTGIDNSDGIYYSHGIYKSEGVCFSDGVIHGHGIHYGRGIRYGNGISSSDEISDCDGICKSKGISQGCGISHSWGISNSKGVFYSKGVDCSNGVSNSIGILNCHSINNSLFCANIPKKCSLFNKTISIKRFIEVEGELKSKLGDWKPKVNNLKSLYMMTGSNWKSTPVNKAMDISEKKLMWSYMPKAAIEYLRSLPEFDSKIFEEITGIQVKKKITRAKK